MARKPYDPLAAIPSPEAIRERLTETVTLAERLRILVDLGGRLHLPVTTADRLPVPTGGRCRVRSPLIPPRPQADPDALAIDQRDAEKFTNLSAKTLDRLADAGEPSAASNSAAACCTTARPLPRGC
ncbi:hypothetical protein R5W23_000117 [Gemmata sp. JC673]|uniref:Uncharacterized protein n=1 Tax=Gemmata algarum TaxID=2975278 RepID=A0ABU5EQV2_9BACT|nr:hypothetical protein [Gemmata algarum]MDY3557590.1 hypothetical protein [Gemmata algarum]